MPRTAEGHQEENLPEREDAQSQEIWGKEEKKEVRGKDRET